MKNLNQPFLILLAFTLILGVLVSSFSPYCSSKNHASLCETAENELEDPLEDRLEEQFDYVEHHVVFTWQELMVEYPVAVRPQAAHASAKSSSYLSSGWLLPLRI